MTHDRWCFDRLVTRPTGPDRWDIGHIPAMTMEVCAARGWCATVDYSSLVRRTAQTTAPYSLVMMLWAYQDIRRLYGLAWGTLRLRNVDTHQIIVLT